MKTYTLKFNQENRDIFDAIKSGQKKVETRAATVKYKHIESGDILKMVCGGDSFEKTVNKAEIFPSIESLLKKYQPEEINPNCHSLADSVAMYHSFPGYEAKIKQFGLIALEI